MSGEFRIRKAVKTRSFFQIAFIGPPGSGKTWNALRMARGFAGPTGRILLIDTERGSGSLYADEPDIAGEFDVIELDTFSPTNYKDAIQLGIKEKYNSIVIDSLTHAWSGVGGALEMVNDITARSKSQNSYVSWRDVTPIHNQMVDAILKAPLDIVVTMRSKVEYVQEKDATGKTVIRKIGLQPQQREGMEYEFTAVLDCDMEHNVIVGKTRCRDIDGKIYRMPGYEIAEELMKWRCKSPERSRDIPHDNEAENVKRMYEYAIDIAGADRVRAELKSRGATSLKTTSLDVMSDVVHALDAEKNKNDEGDF